MLKPVNGHLLIEPVKHESFMASDKNTYEEVGIVLKVCNGIDGINKGDKVFFDGWTAAKFPKNETEVYWLVRIEDVRAIETNE